MKNHRSSNKDVRLILAITNSSPRSNRARANLASFLQKHESLALEPEEVDILARSDQALALGLFASPALVLQSETGERHVLYGDLSDRDALAHFLGYM